MEARVQGVVVGDRSEWVRKFNAAGCGLISIWLGGAMIAHVDGGTFLLGMGAIILALQALRHYFRLGIDAFWIASGCLICAGGAWKLLDVKLEFLPIVCIAAGIVCWISILAGTRRR
jgi:hypothetical protein